MKWITHLVAVLVFLPAVLEASDLRITGIKFFDIVQDDGYIYKGEDKIDILKGTRLEVNEFNIHNNQTIRVMEVHVTVGNKLEQIIADTELRMTVALKIGNIVLHNNVYDNPDHQATEQSAAWFAPMLLFTERLKTISAQSETVVVLGPVMLADILHKYESKRLWPVMLRVEISVEPIKPEDSLSNNTARRDLKIHMLE